MRRELELLYQDLGRGLVLRPGCAMAGWAGGKDLASSSSTYTVKFGGRSPHTRSTGLPAFGLIEEQPGLPGTTRTLGARRLGAMTSMPVPSSPRACWSYTGGHQSSKGLKKCLPAAGT